MAPDGSVTLDRSISSLRAGGFSIEVLAGPAGRRTAVPVKKDQPAAKGGTGAACQCKGIAVR